MKGHIYKFTFLISRNFNCFTTIKMSRGKFIVLEGLDRSGKSSVTQFLQS